MNMQYLEDADYELNSQYDYYREAYAATAADANQCAAEDGEAQDRYDAALANGASYEEAEAAYYGT